MSVLQSTPKQGKDRRIIDQLLNVQWTTHRGWLVALFCVLGVILVAPVWTVKYPPLVDFPNHLASSFVLAHMHDPRFEFSKFYAPNWNLGPYLTMDLILVELQKFLPAMLAGRIFLSLCLLVVPPAVWFFLREANPEEERMAFWSLLLCSNMFFFLYGLLALQLSFALCFVVLGFWLRYLRRPSPSLWWLLCALVTALYFTHLVGFCVAGLVVTSYLISERFAIKKLLASWSLFLPGVTLYLLWKASDTGSWPMFFQTFSGKLESLAAIMLGYSPALDFFTLLVILGCIFWGCADNPELRWNRPWIVALGSLFITFLVLPVHYGAATMIARRLLPFIFVIALAGARIGRRGIYLVPVALLLFVIRSANVEKNFVAIQPHLEDLASSLSVIPENARVLPIIHKPVDFGIPEDYFWAYGVIERGWFSPYLFHDKGVQPIQIRLRAYTMPHYGAFVTLVKPIKWSLVESDYDYVWAYGVSRYSKQMAKIGELMFDSDGLQVYEISKVVTKRHQKARLGITLRQQKVTPGPEIQRVIPGRP